MPGRIVTDKPMRRMAQKRGTTLARVPDATVTLPAQVTVQGRRICPPAPQRLGAVEIQLVDHEVPSPGRRIGAPTPCTWARKSAAGRGGPPGGAIIGPVTIARLRMNEQVPGRRYSTARRSTWPGTSGNPGCVRSRAGPPVSSSVLSTRSPRAARAGAA
jgi:hypothetical protein